MDPNAQVAFNREFFSEDAINRRAEAAQAREDTSKARFEGTFADKQAAARAIQGTFQDRAALDRELKGDFEQNRQLNLDIHGRSADREQAAMDRLKYTQDAENWRGLLQFGPGSVRDRESYAAYGPGGIHEQEIAARNYATEAGMWAHETPPAQYHYGQTEDAQGNKRTVAYLNGRPVAEQSYDWLSKVNHKDPNAIETLHHMNVLAEGPEQMNFLRELSQRNPDAYNALREYSSKAGIGTSTNVATSIEEQRQLARAKLGLSPGTGTVGGSAPGYASPGRPAPPSYGASNRGTGWYDTPKETTPYGQPTRSTPGMTDPGNGAEFVRRGLPEGYNVEGGVARLPIGPMTQGQRELIQPSGYGDHSLTDAGRDLQNEVYRINAMPPAPGKLSATSKPPVGRSGLPGLVHSQSWQEIDPMTGTEYTRTHVWHDRPAPPEHDPSGMGGSAVTGYNSAPAPFTPDDTMNPNIAGEPKGAIKRDKGRELQGYLRNRLGF